MIDWVCFIKLNSRLGLHFYIACQKPKPNSNEIASACLESIELVFDKLLFEILERS